MVNRNSSKLSKPFPHEKKKQNEKNTQQQIPSPGKKCVTANSNFFSHVTFGALFLKLKKIQFQTNKALWKRFVTLITDVADSNWHWFRNAPELFSRVPCLLPHVQFAIFNLNNERVLRRLSLAVFLFHFFFFRQKIDKTCVTARKKVSWVWRAQRMDFLIIAALCLPPLAKTSEVEAIGGGWILS